MSKSFDKNFVALLGKVYVHESDEQHVDRLQHLVNAELLVEMSHSNTLQQQSLPVWRKERPVSVATGPELLTLMEQVRHYQPKAVEFPELMVEDTQIQLERVDERPDPFLFLDPFL